MTSRDEGSWIERNVPLIFRALVALCLVLLAGEFLYEHHAHFDIDGVPGFYAVFGFLAFVFIVYAGKALRRLIMRNEDYYDRR